MVNELILRRFDEQIVLIENIFKKYFNKSVNSNEVNQLNKGCEDVSKIKVNKTIQTKYGISSLCILKDKRLVSGDYKGSIEVYNRSYEPQFCIEDVHDLGVGSLCVLRNGELVSGDGHGDIKVWRINEDDYYLIHTLYGHTEWIRKVIELKDGRISSCSDDGTIIIWDNYQYIQTLQVYNYVDSIIEMNNFIISASEDGTLKIWDESTYQCILTIDDIKCNSNNSLLKLNDNTLIVGGDDVIYFVDIKTYKIKKFKDESLGYIKCLYVNGNGLLFIGNEEGEMVCYDSSSNQIIFKNKFHNNTIYCIIETEDNQLISSSEDMTIKIYN